jgi:hypothetical protein
MAMLGAHDRAVPIVIVDVDLAFRRVAERFMTWASDSVGGRRPALGRGSRRDPGLGEAAGHSESIACVLADGTVPSSGSPWRVCLV